MYKSLRTTLYRKSKSLPPIIFRDKLCVICFFYKKKSKSAALLKRGIFFKLTSYFLSYLVKS